MTYLVERLAELQRYLDQIRDRGPTTQAFESDLTLRKDVLFSLLMIAQLVIDIAGELSAPR